jgi:SAM-dependent methyltransferase
MSLMTQDSIRQHYEGAWQTKSDAAADLSEISYSNPVEDAVLYPIYRQALADLRATVTGGDVLDVGSGSGRWIRFFLEHFTPARLVGVDYTAASVGLLRKWFPADQGRSTTLDFAQADITAADLDLGRRFDLINIANVLFHIPEQDKFERALANLAKHVKPTGLVVTTEYLPRTSMRTPWMLVRDRYSFEQSVARAGLRVVAVKASAVFANDPMGIDGPDAGPRGHFNNVRQLFQTLSASVGGTDGPAYLVKMYAEVERAVLAFCKERVPDIDMPSQKLVFLAPAEG